MIVGHAGDGAAAEYAATSSPFDWGAADDDGRGAQ